MNVFYPAFAVARFPAMLRYALTGALIASVYGAAHDQISFAISPEYFTQLKFRQFAWANAGWPPRVFASVVGVLATWWAGLFAGWFMARVGLDQMPEPQQRRTAIRAFSMVLAATIVGGSIGAAIGYLTSRGDVSGWDEWREKLRLGDVPSFVIVAWLHGCGYAGALLGLIGALVYVRRRKLQVPMVGESGLAAIDSQQS